MESHTRVERNVSVVEGLEDRVSADHVMRILTVAWLAPAFALLALGLSAMTDLAFIEGADQVQRLHEVRALETLLSILTVLVGTIWALRTWDLLPGLKSIKDDGWRFGPQFHYLALVIAALAVLVAPFADRIAAGAELILWWTAAVSACLAGAVLPRWLRQIGEFSSQWIAVFAGIIVYQLTIGWLHMLTWTTVGSVVLIAEGLTMVVVCVAATAGVPAFGRRRLRIAQTTEPERKMSSGEQGAGSTVQAQLSGEAPAVVH